MTPTPNASSHQPVEVILDSSRRPGHSGECVDCASARGGGGGNGAVREWQEHAALYAGRAGSAIGGHGHARWRRIRTTCASVSRQPFATNTSGSCSRITLFCRSARCSRTCSRPRSLLGALAPRGSRRSGPAKSLTRWVSAHASIIGRGSCRAVRNSVRRSPERLFEILPWFSATSRPVTSTPRSPIRSPALLLDLHHARQTILIVVTHSVSLAQRFPRRYEMRDHALHPAG